MLELFQQLVEAKKVSYSPLSAIRVKVHVPCQLTFEFCHMEGNHFSSAIQNNHDFASALSQFRERFGFQEVHYTGGEPSIHSQIVDLITTAKTLGFSVKMTTNGQTELERYEKCISAGLEELNVSVHTLSGKELGGIMNPPRKEAWGARAVERQLSLIAALRSQVSVKINTCVGENEGEAFRIAQFAFQQGIEWRPMNILEQPTESYAALLRLCDVLGARPTEATLIRGSSSFRIVMETPDGFVFKVKLILPFRLPSMCTGCSLDQLGQCYEYAYGPRLEMQDKKILVRNCVQRVCEPCVLPIDEYFQHQLAQDLSNALNE